MTESLRYPDTRREPVVEEQFGVAVADPYRWLENDVRGDAEVAAWVEAQNAVTAAYLDGGLVAERDGASFDLDAEFLHADERKTEIPGPLVSSRNREWPRSSVGVTTGAEIRTKLPPVLGIEQSGPP